MQAVTTLKFKTEEDTLNLGSDAKRQYNTRSATEVDRIVGTKLVLARKLRSHTQTTLGDLVGVKFQQIQKYESGANRIPASRLFAIAKALQMPLTFFFPEEEGSESELESLLMPLNQLSPHDAQKVLNALDQVDDTTRKHFVDLISVISRKIRA